MEEQDLENNFEKLLREKADGFQLKPTAGVWTAVSNSLQSNKHKNVTSGYGLLQSDY